MEQDNLMDKLTTLRTLIGRTLVGKWLCWVIAKLTRLRFKGLYFRYWLLTREEELLFDLYGAKALRQRIIMYLNPREIEYALAWQTFPKTVPILPKLKPPPGYNPFQIAGWYSNIFVFDYGTIDLVNIIGGRWDLEENVVRFDDTIVYEAFQQAFLGNAEWKDTEYYNYYKNYFYPNDGRKLEARMQYNQFLYNKIKAEGYLARDKVVYDKFEDSHPQTPVQLRDEIRIAVGRTRKPILVDGNHRLAVAKLLGCERIPVRIVLVHPEVNLGVLLNQSVFAFPETP